MGLDGSPFLGALLDCPARAAPVASPDVPGTEHRTQSAVHITGLVVKKPRLRERLSQCLGVARVDGDAPHA
jgi:hypothetical protein